MPQKKMQMRAFWNRRSSKRQESSRPRRGFCWVSQELRAGMRSTDYDEPSDAAIYPRHIRL